MLVAHSQSAAHRVLDRFGGEVDVVLSDVVMPEDGLSSVRSSTARFPHLRTVLMTAHVPSVDEDALVWTDGPVLAKPFTSDELNDALRRSLTR